MSPFVGFVLHLVAISWNCTFPEKEKDLAQKTQPSFPSPGGLEPESSPRWKAPSFSVSEEGIEEHGHEAALWGKTLGTVARQMGQESQSKMPLAGLSSSLLPQPQPLQKTAEYLLLPQPQH